MPSHPESYMHRQRLHSPMCGWMWWLMPYVLVRGHCPKVWWYRIPTLRCAMAARMLPLWWGIVWHTLRPWKEDPSGNSGGCQSGAWAVDVVWHNRCIGWGPRHLDTETDCITEAGKAVWEVRFERLGILVTRAGKFCWFTPGWISWHLLLRTLWAQLYSFNWTCSLSHWWCPI